MWRSGRRTRNRDFNASKEGAFRRARPSGIGLAIVVLAAAHGTASVAFSAGITDGGWTTYRNARHGYMIAYPTNAFAEPPENETEDGRVVVSKSGSARLLVGAFDNSEMTSLADYRAYVLERNYAGATIDYAPVRNTWFVLSGTRDGTMFYERVSFTCGGRLINSWALLYPAAERKTWDRIVERVARTYTTGSGRDGDCQ